METWLEALKTVLPLVGVFVGWLFSQKSERNRLLREDNKRLNKTIFFLLELRYQLSLYSDREREVLTYVNTFHRKLQQLPGFENVKQADYEPYMMEMINEILSKPIIADSDISKLNTNYTSCVENLSEIDPVLAYRLHGRQNFKEILDQFLNRAKESITHLTDKHQASETDLYELNKGMASLEPNLLKELEKDVEEILLDLAKRVDKKTRKDVQDRIKRFAPDFSSPEMEAMIGRLVQDFFKHFNPPVK
jgi:hypothetical protein